MNGEITYTFSRALHLMRYGGKKMKFDGWQEGIFIYVNMGMMFFDCGRQATLTQREIMGSWVEVK